MIISQVCHSTACISSNSLSRWRRAKFDPPQNMYPVTDWKNWHSWSCPREYLCAKFCVNPSMGLPANVWNITKILFSYYTYCFSVTHLQVRPLEILHMMAQMTHFHARMCLLGLENFKLIPGGAKKRPEHSHALCSRVINRFLKFLDCYIQR